MANFLGKITVAPFTAGNSNALAVDTATEALSVDLNRRYCAIYNGTSAELFFAWSESGQAAVQTADIDFMEVIPANGAFIYDVLAIPTGTLYLRSVLGGDARVATGV